MLQFVYDVGSRKFQLPNIDIKIGIGGKSDDPAYSDVLETLHEIFIGPELGSLNRLKTQLM